MLASGILPSPLPLHIPDGFLSVHISMICWALTVAVVGVSLWRSGKTLGGRQVPLMGVLAAFVFAAQMLNFTVLGGTSGHLIGGALAAILLGPWAAILTACLVVITIRVCGLFQPLEAVARDRVLQKRVSQGALFPIVVVGVTQECLDELGAWPWPRTQAAALVLRHSGLSYAEVAAALHLSPGSVGTTVRRAESHLLEELNRHASPE